MNLGTIQLQTPYLELDDELYDLSTPIALEDPYLIHFNDESAKLIGIEPQSCDDEQIVSLLNTQFLPQGGRYFSMCYAGHQFGNYAPRLGDGRTHNLGKINGYNLQLKGSGETLYSRMADGRATLRSSIREYLMAESMHHLGIPTTRSLAIIGSKSKIVRSSIEEAAIVMRLSKSWIRFGSFEYLYYANEHSKLESLAEYVIGESFSHLKNDDDRFYKMFCEVLNKTATLVAKWQAIGFNHGVLNTDNMSIEGLTIDYGPFAMMDDFNYGYVCNHTDKIGRYSYGEQPNVSYWNLTMLAKALSPLIERERMQKKLDAFGESIYPHAYLGEMRKKLGLQRELEEDLELVKELIGTLHDIYVDYTLFFRTLSRYNGEREALFDIVMEPVALDAWLNLYDARVQKEKRSQQERQEAMLRVNPKYILKNYMLQKAIDKALQKDFTMVEELMFIARHPYDELKEFEHYAGDTPEEYKNIGLACSS